jgi:uncharacterized protein (DUF983 family)
MNLKLLKGTKLYSILKSTCPVCQEGKLYCEPNPYKISQIFKMPERCSNCKTKYKIEPSFFFGAMYVSYAIGVAFGTAALVISYFVFNLNRLQTFLIIVGTLIVFLPIIARVSRNIWLNMFFSYKD